MRLIALASPHTVELYQSIFELPASAHLEFKCYLAQELGIGADTASVERHFQALAAFVAAGQTTEALDELAHLHYSFQFQLEQFSPASLAFGCLVARVDGQPVTDRSEAGLTRLRAQLSGWGLSAGMVAEELETVKKNCNPNWRPTSPPASTPLASS